MKKWLIIAIFVLSNPINSLSLIQNEPEFIPFQLQYCRNYSKHLTNPENTENSIIEINVINSSAELELSYYEYIKERTYYIHYEYLSEGDYVNISFKGSGATIYLQNYDDMEKLANYTAYGQYRMHNEVYNPNKEWEEFHLTLCNPNRLDIWYSEENWVDNITVLIDVEYINNGTLELNYWYSDFGVFEPITESGNYSYTLNASLIDLDLEEQDQFDYITAVGSYAIINNGHLYTQVANGSGFSYLIGFLALLVVLKRRKKY